MGDQKVIKKNKKNTLNHPPWKSKFMFGTIFSGCTKSDNLDNGRNRCRFAQHFKTLSKALFACKEKELRKGNIIRYALSLCSKEVSKKTY